MHFQSYKCAKNSFSASMMSANDCLRYQAHGDSLEDYLAPARGGPRNLYRGQSGGVWGGAMPYPVGVWGLYP